MLEFLLDLFINLGSFFYLILNTVMYLFAVHCLLNFKKLRLGFSQSNATILDIIIICLVPLIMTYFAVLIYYEFNPN